MESQTETNKILLKLQKNINKFYEKLLSVDNNILKNYEIIKNEIKKYKNKVEKKNELICLTKCDLLDRNKLKYKISELKKVCKKEIYYCSNITGEGIKEVLKKLENLYGKKKN